MLAVYEFEVFLSKNTYVAIPFDFEGGTQGRTIQEVSKMAADWLKTELEMRLIANEGIPEPTFGNEPTHDGKTLLVAVEASLDTIPTMSAAEAATQLGVSRPRVSQMIKSEILIGFRKGRDTRVTVASVQARLADTPKSGRPKREAVRT